ncbi:MAG: D-aminoacylase [Nitrospinae bacterium]|nr:D-aminoacylase [Nitrospinota bacterium]
MYDLIIKNIKIYDGSGGEPFVSDVGIKGDRIEKIGSIMDEIASASPRNDKLINGEGLCLSPGFVDIHSHSDYYLLIDPLAQSKVRQGVTTEVGGNCGYSASPIFGSPLLERKKSYKEQFGLDLNWTKLKGYNKKIEENGISLNYCQLIGHNTVRASVAGVVDRKPSSDEMKEMERIVEEAMNEGAVGMSVGFAYTPSCFAKKEEVANLCKIVAKKRGVFTTHIRSEGRNLIESIEEVIDIARVSGVRLQISHLKTFGEENWGKLDKVFELIKSAIDDGIDIACDRYPYTAANTGLQAVLPDWVFNGGKEKAIERLKNNKTRNDIRDELSKKYPSNGYWDSVMISQVVTDKNKETEGKKVREAWGKGQGARGRKGDLLDFLFDLLIEENLEVDAIYFSMSEDNMKRILKKDYVMIGSDSGARSTDGVLGLGLPHPRTFGTFPRVLGKYCRDEKLFDLPTAIYKMTSFPCKRIGIKDRGVIKEGCFADLVIFNPDTISDIATYESPKNYPKGIEYVIVNGKITVKDGEHSGAKAGSVLKKG